MVYSTDRGDNNQQHPSAGRPLPSRQAGHGVNGGSVSNTPSAPPVISLPKGGGAIRNIGEKFQVSSAPGTASLSVPVYTTPGRSGFGPQLSLSYDSGAGNGPFGLGWSLSIPSITRKTDKGLPRYRDREDSDIFILSGAEDLVPALLRDGGGGWKKDIVGREEAGEAYTVFRYRPRVEGLFAPIERWVRERDGDTHWRSTSKENVKTIYGRSPNARITDPENGLKIFSWLIEETFDDKGNAILYEYASEDSAGVDPSQAHERNRTDRSRSANRYLKRIKYGNRTSRLVSRDTLISNPPRSLTSDMRLIGWLDEHLGRVIRRLLL